MIVGTDCSAVVSLIIKVLKLIKETVFYKVSLGHTESLLSVLT